MHPAVIGRNRRKELKRQAFDARAKLRSIGSIPRNDGIETPELLHQLLVVIEFQHVEAGGRDGAGAIGKPRHRQVLRGRPHFGIPGPQRLHGGQGKNEIANGSGADDESSADSQSS